MQPKDIPNKSNLSASVFLALKDRIIRWQYPPGYRFTEEQLCDEFKMSRSPVREALRMLVENGLVDKVPHRGYSVKQPNTEEINELYDVRLALETYIVERVTEKGMPHSVWEPLRQTWDAMLQHLPHIDENVSREDERFHETLARATDNKTLLDLLHSLNERLSFARMTDITTVERLRITCQQHLQILDSIAARDVAGARDAMRHNIEQGRDNVEIAFKEALARAYRDQRSPERPFISSK
ncbi:MAG: GntR family transcriptional regulator [Anaerolineales bacterium]